MASDSSNKTSTLDLAAIGNRRTAALLDAAGRIVWWCFPRFDSDPVFSRLLAGTEEKGFCDVCLEGAVARQASASRSGCGPPSTAASPIPAGRRAALDRKEEAREMFADLLSRTSTP